jgi:hypothetical protein
MDRGRRGELADAAGACLTNAEQADHVGAVGVEAQAAVGQRAGVGGEEGLARLVLGLAVGAPDMGAFVANGAHQLAAAVLEDRDAEVCAQREIEAAQVVLIVAVHRKATQLHDAGAVLELVGDIVAELVESGEPDVFTGDLRPLHAAQALHGRVQFVDLLERQVAYPAGGTLDLVAGPHGRAGQGRAGAHGGDLSSPEHGPRKGS